MDSGDLQIGARALWATKSQDPLLAAPHPHFPRHSLIRPNSGPRRQALMGIWSSGMISVSQVAFFAPSVYRRSRVRSTVSPRFLAFCLVSHGHLACVRWRARLHRSWRHLSWHQPAAARHRPNPAMHVLARLSLLLPVRTSGGVHDSTSPEHNEQRRTPAISRLAKIKHSNLPPEHLDAWGRRQHSSFEFSVPENAAPKRTE